MPPHVLHGYSPSFVNFSRFPGGFGRKLGDWQGSDVTVQMRRLKRRENGVCRRSYRQRAALWTSSTGNVTQLLKCHVPFLPLGFCTDCSSCREFSWSANLDSSVSFGKCYFLQEFPISPAWLPRPDLQVTLYTFPQHSASLWTSGDYAWLVCSCLLHICTVHDTK